MQDTDRVEIKSSAADSGIGVVDSTIARVPRIAVANDVHDANMRDTSRIEERTDSTKLLQVKGGPKALAVFARKILNVGGIDGAKCINGSGRQRGVVESKEVNPVGGNLDKAEADLTRSIQLNPGAVLARIELARTYLDKGEHAQIRPLLTEAIKLAHEQERARELAEARQLLAEIEADSR